MRYYIGETWVEGENEQEEVINSLMEYVEKKVERKAFLENSGLDENIQESIYEGYMAYLSECMKNT